MITFSSEFNLHNVKSWDLASFKILFQASGKSDLLWMPSVFINPVYAVCGDFKMLPFKYDGNGPVFLPRIDGPAEEAFDIPWKG